MKMGSCKRESGNMKCLKMRIGMTVNLLQLAKICFKTTNTYIEQSYASICAGCHQDWDLWRWMELHNLDLSFRLRSLVRIS